MEVRFGKEVVDLATRTEPISQTTFQHLMDEEPDKPFFTFARVHSIGNKRQYEHLYSAENVIEWYPLNGRTDPCTRGSIEKIEYYMHFKGEQDAIHVGDVYEEPIGQVSKTADYFIWYHIGEDEPSKMSSLLATAYLQILGLTNITSNDTFDTSSVSQLGQQRLRCPGQKVKDQLNGTTLYHYVCTRIAKLIERGEINCSDPDVLMTSIKHDAAHHLAGVLVSQDPDVEDGSDDFARLPHVRTNSLATTIIELLLPSKSLCLMRGASN